jgi:hypothetical protein
MNNLLDIDSISGFKKDPISGAYVNVDKGVLAEAKYRKKLNKTILDMQAEINTLKEEVNKLKKLLTE